MVTKQRAARYVNPKQVEPIIGATMIAVQCTDCGHTGRLWREQIESLSEAGCRTFADLGRKLKCHRCHQEGGIGKNMTLEAFGMKLK